MSLSSTSARCRCCWAAMAGCQGHEPGAYADMLKECFGLLWHLDGASLQICERCAARLRECVDFRRLCVRSEESFLEELSGGGTSAAAARPMTVERVKQENSGASQTDSCHADSDDSWDAGDTAHKPTTDSFKGKPLTKTTFSKDEKISLSELLPRASDGARAAKVKSESATAKKPSSRLVATAAKLKSNESTYEKVVKQSEKTSKKRATTIFAPTSFKGITVKPRTYNIQPIRISSLDPQPFRENNPEDMAVSNAALIIEHSNAYPFKCVYNEYLCFYCGTTFYDPQLLKEHTNEHSTEKLRRLLHFHRLTKVDVSDLICKLCGERITDLNTLKEHLISSHDKRFFSEVGDGVLPFKLSKNSLNCALCSATFPFFQAVNQHMNEHFPNYVCETCGLGFVEQSRLQVHTSKHNMTGSHPCDTCGKVFKSDYTKKLHIDRIHNKKGRIYCPYCPERFLTRQQKLNHLVSAHGKAPETHQCTYCERTFKTRNQLTVHTRKLHLKDYRFECSYCGRKFFTKKCLDDHVPTHTGERKFKCGVCDKAYPREKTLKEHLRIHNNDKRFSCSVCGQAFVQKCSLNGHMKTHHPECGGV